MPLHPQRHGAFKRLNTGSYTVHHSTQRRNVGPRSASAVAAAASLSDLPLTSILNPQGLIQPEIPEDALASVLAIYDDKQKLQYVGFSKDLRNTLRTLFSRRPDKAFYYRTQHLQALDQAEMMAVRDSWFEEVGGPPIGNKLALERAAWQQPVEAFAISERGKQAAAEENAKQLQQAIKDRGCKEEFLPNPELLILGQVSGSLLCIEVLWACILQCCAGIMCSRCVHQAWLD